LTSEKSTYFLLSFDINLDIIFFMTPDDYKLGHTAVAAAYEITYNERGAIGFWILYGVSNSG
jgi:hypothetical protein